MVDPLDLFQAAEPDAPPPPWHELTLDGKIYRWRFWRSRVSEHFQNTRDPHHPDLWFRMPDYAFEVEYAALDRDQWCPVRNYDRRWEIWQRARTEPGMPGHEKNPPPTPDTA